MLLVPISSLIDGRDGISQDQDAVNQMVLVDPPYGTSKKRHIHAIAAAAAGNQELQDHLDYEE